MSLRILSIEVNNIEAEARFVRRATLADCLEMQHQHTDSGTSLRNLQYIQLREVHPRTSIDESGL